MHHGEKRGALTGGVFDSPRLRAMLNRYRPGFWSGFVHAFTGFVEPTVDVEFDGIVDDEALDSDWRAVTDDARRVIEKLAMKEESEHIAHDE